MLKSRKILCASMLLKADNSLRTGIIPVKTKRTIYVFKAWCDVYTDGGGFMLVGHQNNSNLWTIPSSSTPVDPHGPAQFSSLFGKFDVQDFAVQVSTSQSFKETKAHWYSY